MSTEEDFKFDKEHYNVDGSPTFCFNCECNFFIEHTTSTLNGLICEYAINCRDCDTLVGYWAYGHFDPDFAYELDIE